MTLVIDIGNTFTKIAVFKRDELLHTSQFQVVETEELNSILKDYQVEDVIISTVKKNKEEWQSVLSQKVPLTYFNIKMTKGIINHYRTPETLGLDRLAAVIGAHYLYPDKNSVIIDAGTCITYDSVDAGGNYFGGSI